MFILVEDVQYPTALHPAQNAKAKRWSYYLWSRASAGQVERWPNRSAAIHLLRCSSRRRGWVPVRFPLSARPAARNEKCPIKHSTHQTQPQAPYIARLSLVPFTMGLGVESLRAHILRTLTLDLLQNVNASEHNILSTGRANGKIINIEKIWATKLQFKCSITQKFNIIQTYWIQI